MSWKKHFQIVPATSKLRIPRQTPEYGGGAAAAKYGSWLPEVYSGQPNRLERYAQYDQMNLDSEVAAALDIIADFCTQGEDTADTPFRVHYYEDPTETETKLIESALHRWCKLNDFRRRMWKIFRDTVMYGDQFFIRDPETQELVWISHDKVMTIIVNESKGKKPEQYVVRDLDLNMQEKVATNEIINPQNNSFPTAFPSSPFSMSNAMSANTPSQWVAPTAKTRRFDQRSQQLFRVDAEHIVHISLSEGMDAAWPFGNSILESVFKTFKQKELLEDSIIIYRVQRAPERRVFYIDVGTMPTHKAMAFVERVKNEIHQRRIPNRTGGGTSILDAAYNPMSIVEDYFFAQCLNLSNKINLLDGRTVELREVIDEYNHGKKNYVYSLNLNTMEMEPAEITWAGITRKNAQQVRVHLDNGEYIDSTPDHRFILRDGAEIEAQHLKPNDSLMPLYLTEVPTSKNGKSTYTQYVSNRDGKKRWVHTAVCPKTKNGTEIHHIDYNSKNNNPDNLIEMDYHEHRELHRNGKFLSTAWEDSAKREKIQKGMRLYHDTMSDQDKEMIRSRNRLNGQKTWTGNKFHQSLRALEENRIKVYERISSIQYDDFLFQRFCHLYDTHKIYRKRKFAEIIKNDDQFMSHYKKINIEKIGNDKNCLRIINTFTETKIDDLCSYAGYETFTDFKQTYKTNHKVVNVEWLEERSDTCDITVVGPSESHIFALAAGVYVHNSAEGRGSKVETLPGGENLGEIDDLRFFNNKLVRGLRVPSSYLPSGPEDSTMQYNDGRVGTAYIQEYRFAKHCQRLQTVLSPVFDDEFKRYLRKRGITVDPSMFELRFHPPQNFSKYRQMAIDGERISMFTQLSGTPWIARRTLAARYLGWTEDEILKNERMVEEERGTKAVVDSGESMLGGGGIGARDIGFGGPGGGLDGDSEDFGGGEGGEGELDMGDLGGGEDSSPEET